MIKYKCLHRNLESQFSGYRSSLQKHPLKEINSGGKTHFGSHTNGVRISPVLNLPPCTTKGSTGLFGSQANGVRMSGFCNACSACLLLKRRRRIAEPRATSDALVCGFQFLLPQLRLCLQQNLQYTRAWSLYSSFLSLAIGGASSPASARKTMACFLSAGSYSTWWRRSDLQSVTDTFSTTLTHCDRDQIL